VGLEGGNMLGERNRKKRLLHCWEFWVRMRMGMEIPL
jgi:hypothetical protein